MGFVGQCVSYQLEAGDREVKQGHPTNTTWWFHNLLVLRTLHGHARILVNESTAHIILWVTVFRDPQHPRGNQTDPLKDNKTKSILNHIAFPNIPFVKSKSAEGWNWVETDGAQDTTCSRSRGRTKWGVTAEGSLDFNTAVPGSLWCHHDGVWLCCGWVWIQLTSCKVQLLPHRKQGRWLGKARFQPSALQVTSFRDFLKTEKNYKMS